MQSIHINDLWILYTWICLLSKNIVTPKSVLTMLLQLLADMHRAAQIWSCPAYTPR